MKLVQLFDKFFFLIATLSYFNECCVKIYLVESAFSDTFEKVVIIVTQ